MTRDKQLRDIDLDQVVEKRRLDQALNAKEFAVLAGISYSAARAWFHQPGFPVVCGVVFWQDFVEWRRGRATKTREEFSEVDPSPPNRQSNSPKTSGLPSRALNILAQAS